MAAPSKSNQTSTKTSVDAQNFYTIMADRLKKKDLPGVVFLYGEEDYLLQHASLYVKQGILMEGVDEFNYRSYYAPEVDIGELRDELQTLPMLCSQRVIWVKEVHELKEREWEILEPLIKEPTPMTVLLLTTRVPDKRKKYFKWLTESSFHCEFKKPFDNQVPSWIRHIAQSRGLILTEEASHKLHQLVGSVLVEIDAEIRKLEMYLGDRKDVEIEDVEACVSRRREENIFDFTKALGEAKKTQSISHLNSLLQQGQNELGILSMVARHLRLLILLKQGQAEGLQGVKLAQYAQVPPYFISNYLQQAKLWSVRSLEKSLVLIADADRNLKAPVLPSHFYLETLVLKICGLAGS